MQNEDGEDLLCIETGFDIPVILGTPPTKKSLKRFHQGIELLGLKAFAHANLERKGEPLVLGSGGVALEEGPQHMLLLRNQGS